MKNKILSTFVAIISLLLFSQCTQPGGYIGDWFGSWHLESIEINGETDEDYKGNLMVSFQGKIFDFGYLDSVEIYGTWSYAGEILTLIAGYDAGTGSNMNHLFNPFPTSMHFPAEVDQIEITVTHIGSKTMQWQYIDQNGQLITYNFRKYP